MSAGCSTVEKNIAPSFLSTVRAVANAASGVTRCSITSMQTMRSISPGGAVAAAKNGSALVTPAKPLAASLRASAPSPPP